MDKAETAPAAPPDWIEALAESEADIEAGHTVPLEPVLAPMRASVDRMEARRAARAEQAAESEWRGLAAKPSGNSTCSWSISRGSIARRQSAI